MKTIQAPAPTEPRERLDRVQRAAPPAKPPADAADGVATMILPPLVGALIGIVSLAAIGIYLLGQAGLAAFGAALLGQHAAWYLSRASAFVAYLLLWWSMILGLSITNRLARVWPGGPAAADLHEHASLLGLGFGLLHALVLLGDQYIGYTLLQILIPFANAGYQPLWVGLGQIGLYLMALVTFSFYVRRWIGARAWRAIHFLSFVVFVLALLHGLFSGTDSSAPWAIWMYASTGLSVLAMTIYRFFAQRRRGAAPPTRLAAAQRDFGTS
jgi:predicted ferric reductase